MLQFAPESSQSLCRFRRRQHIARSGETPDAIYWIKEGWAARYTALSGGRRQITALYLPGDYCEPHWLIRPYCSAPVIALTRVTARRVPIGDETGERYDPRKLLTATAGLIERQSNWIVSLGRKTAIERISMVIVELFDRLTATGAGDRDRIFMPLTQAELADIAGLTAIHVNRVMRTLKTSGIIKADKQSLTVRDRAALQSIAEGGLTSEIATSLIKPGREWNARPLLEKALA